MILMTRTVEKDKELQIYSRLPELARLLLYMFVSEKKSSLPLSHVTEKLENCYRITLTESEMKDHIELLAKELPDWLVLHKNSEKIPFVKIDRRADLSVITSKLEASIKAKYDS
ncbi:hypothetical protein HHI36_019496 [Cryptolaemus montrouzieri]|uniref:DNA replication factor Cdt1 C-terminal domain-containing protein n=1 Tax=Cryptolaemus montrouzieri TaxID=559131 RepID=A0ABD2P412_9CUCU